MPTKKNIMLVWIVVGFTTLLVSCKKESVYMEMIGTWKGASSPISHTIIIYSNQTGSYESGGLTIGGYVHYKHKVLEIGSIQLQVEKKPGTSNGQTTFVAEGITYIKQ